MPIPEPKKNEKHQDFIDRCMGDDVMVKDYPDQKQRYAICQSHWENKEKKSDESNTESGADLLLGEEDRAVWSTAYINDLADSCFLYVEGGGKKDADGKTIPRTLRHFPYKDKDGKVDLPHLRNALSRIPQSNLSQSIKAMCTAKVKKIMAEMMGDKKSDDEPEGMERRYVVMPVEVRDDGDGKVKKLVGYGAVFNSRTSIGWFDEQVAQGCFMDTIAHDDIRGLFNHDPSLILGRSKAKPSPTMRLFEDSKGLRFEIDLADTQVGRDTLTNVQRGDVSGCSFSFLTVKDEWDRSNPDHPVRTLLRVKLFDVGPVTFPAYADTSVAARSLEVAKEAEKTSVVITRIIDKRANEPEKAPEGPKSDEKAPEIISDERKREIERGYRKAERIINRNRNRPPEA